MVSGHTVDYIPKGKYALSVRSSTFVRPSQVKHKQNKRTFFELMRSKPYGTVYQQRLALSSYYRQAKQTRCTFAKQLAAYLMPTGRYKGRNGTESVLPKGVIYRIETSKEAQDDLSIKILVCYQLVIQTEINIYYTYPLTMDILAFAAVSTSNKYSKLICTLTLFSFVKVRRRRARRPREPRRVAKTYSSTKTLPLYMKKIEGNYTPNYYNVEISTLDVSAVSVTILCYHFPIPSGPSRLDQNRSRRPKVTRRKTQAFSSTKTNYFNLKLEGNSLPHYVHNVEISTRDDFAVITAIKATNFPHPYRTPRPTTEERTRTRRSGKPWCTSKTCKSTKVTCTCILKLEDNYTPNYDNVEISTRDVSAVIKKFIKGARTLVVRYDLLSRLFERRKKADAEGDKEEVRVNMHIIKPITRGYRVANYKLSREECSRYNQRTLQKIVRIKIDTTNVTEWVWMKYTPGSSYRECTYEHTKLMENLFYEILPRNYSSIAYGTEYSKAKKYERENRSTKRAGNNGRGLSHKVKLCLDMVRITMVNPNGVSFANKLPIRPVISTTIITIKSALKTEKVQCHSMSRQEIAKAVEQIQQAPPTSELEALQAFIEAQNTPGTLYITDTCFMNSALRDISFQIGHESSNTHDTAEAGPADINTVPDTNSNRVTMNEIALPGPVRRGDNNGGIMRIQWGLKHNMHLMNIFLHIGSHVPPSQANTSTPIENPGYTTQSEMVLHEPVQFHYIYDPINDIMKRVEKTTNVTRDVGQGKQGESNSTGKPRDKVRTYKGPLSLTNKKQFSYYLTGTESRATSTDRATTTDAHNIQHDAPANKGTMVQANSSTEPPREVVRDSDSDSDNSSDSGELSCSFSSDEEVLKGASKNDGGTTKEYSQERHARIDNRIAKQKTHHWKGKGGLKSNEDPRSTAIIPIHAPKMERMNLANLKALEDRAKSKLAPIAGDILTPIIDDINNTAEINYSVVAVGGGFCTQNEVVKQLAASDPSAATTTPTTHKEVVRKLATNGPNSVRPKAPKGKTGRVDRVLPFPKRRLAAMLHEKETRKAKKRNSTTLPAHDTSHKQRALTDSGSDTPVSDASWPTDQDDSIATLRLRGPNAKTGNGSRHIPPAKKVQQKKGKKVQTRKGKQPKKPLMKDIDCMIAALQAPLPKHVLPSGSSLGEKETKNLIKKHAARIRARRARLLKKASNFTPLQDSSQKDPLARAIDLAGILEDSDVIPQHDSTTMDGDVLDVAIDNVIEALDSPSSSSSSSDDSSSSSSSASSDSNDSTQWGAVRTRVLNPFAVRTPEAGRTEGASTYGEAANGINRTHNLRKLTVTIQKLSSEVLEKFNCSSSNLTVCHPLEEKSMSAKNISKDRSGSRNRQDKQDRFKKGRTGENEDGDADTGQAGDGQGNGSKNQGGAGAGQEIPSGKRPRDPPKTGTHDDTTQKTRKCRARRGQ